MENRNEKHEGPASTWTRKRTANLSKTRAAILYRTRATICNKMLSTKRNATLHEKTRDRGREILKNVGHRQDRKANKNKGKAGNLTKPTPTDQRPRKRTAAGATFLQNAVAKPPGAPCRLGRERIGAKRPGPDALPRPAHTLLVGTVFQNPLTFFLTVFSQLLSKLGMQGSRRISSGNPPARPNNTKTTQERRLARDTCMGTHQRCQITALDTKWPMGISLSTKTHGKTHPKSA